MAEAAPFVCRPADLDALHQHLAAVKAGAARTVVVEAPLGGGKRALVGELVRTLPAGEDTVVVRALLSDEEDGFRTILRVYAALYGALYRDSALKGKVELLLNTQLPNKPARVQGWFNAFIEGLKKGAPEPGAETFQVSIPRDNPVIGLVEILGAIGQQLPILLDLQNIHACHSISLFQVLEALLDTQKDTKILTLLSSEPTDGAARAWMPAPWIDLLDRRGSELSRLNVAPWGEDEVKAFLAAKGLEAAAPARLAEIAHGRPAYLVELVDLLSEQGRLGEPLEDVTLSSLTPRDPDEDELEEPPSEIKEGQRRHATAADADRLQFLGALLGLSFPSGLIADMDNWDRDSADDLFDACGDLLKELQFSKPLGTWVYAFQKAIYRQGVLDLHTSENDRQIAVRVGAFMERYLVPRGYEFLVKTVRMYGESGALDRANVLRNMALAGDRPDLWAMMNDLVRYYGQVQWPDAMRRTIYMHFLDRMVGMGEPDSTERLFQEALAWAKSKNDGPMVAWVTFAGARLDYRRQDMYRSRDRGNDALRLYKELNESPKVAEVYNHLAMVEFNDGNNNAALDRLRLALETSNTPPIQANVEYVRGLIARKARRLPEASEHFRKANELAGQVGLAQLALEAGFQYGESLFASQLYTKAADVLVRVAQIAQVLQNQGRERATAALLAQTHGALKNYEAALQMANRTLQLSQELKFDRFIPVDLYNVAFFQLQLGRPTEALSLLNKARERAPADDANFSRELSFHIGLCTSQIGERSTAIAAFQHALTLARQTKEVRRLIQTAEHLANLEMARNDKVAAAKYLQEALNVAEANNLREERKGIRRRLEEVQGV